MTRGRRDIRRKEAVYPRLTPGERTADALWRCALAPLILLFLFLSLAALRSTSVIDAQEPVRERILFARDDLFSNLLTLLAGLSAL
ncbi:MAG: hypothetical protein Q4C13_06895, partial [Clostridia bacterium]|nr:hypothetical protein [Clostridia bacterium]